MRKSARGEVIKEIYETLRKMREHLERKDPERSEWVYPAMKYFELAYQNMMLQKPMLWHFFLLPVEIFRSMDVVAFSPEYACGVMSTFRGGPVLKYLDVGSARVSEELCAVNRFPIGLMFSGDTLTPDMIVYAPAHPCDSAKAAYSNLGYYFNIPSFYLDLPLLSDERGKEYVVKQYRKMISFMEEQSKQKLDWDRLREVIGHANQANEYAHQLNELRKNTPSPVPSRLAVICGGAIMGLGGTPEIVEWFRMQCDLAKGRVRNVKGIAREQKVRLLWIANAVNFDLSILDWLEAKYGAVTVASLFHMYPSEPIDNTRDEDTILQGLATRALEYPMGRHGRGPVDLYINECINVARDYKVDAVIFAGNTGCKWNWATAQLVKDTIYDKLKIPTLTFELVPNDPRVVSYDSIKAKFEQFFELVM